MRRHLLSSSIAAHEAPPDLRLVLALVTPAAFAVGALADTPTAATPSLFPPPGSCTAVTSCRLPPAPMMLGGNALVALRRCAAGVSSRVCLHPAATEAAWAHREPGCRREARIFASVNQHPCGCDVRVGIEAHAGHSSFRTGAELQSGPCPGYASSGAVTICGRFCFAVILADKQLLCRGPCLLLILRCTGVNYDHYCQGTEETQAYDVDTIYRSASALSGYLDKIEVHHAGSACPMMRGC